MIYIEDARKFGSPTAMVLQSVRWVQICVDVPCRIIAVGLYGSDWKLSANPDLDWPILILIQSAGGFKSVESTVLGMMKGLHVACNPFEIFLIHLSYVLPE